MFYKIILFALFAVMIFNLFRAMMLMTKNDPDKPPMSKFIGRRVMYSGLIVLLVIIGLLTGLITPNPRPY